MLNIQNLHVRYGAIEALKGLSIEVKAGEIIALIGPNGAGKTTLLRTISGLLKPSTGMMIFEGHSLNRLEPHQIVKLGISQAPEGRMIFQNLSVEENLDLGAYTRKRNDRFEDLEKIFSLFPRLKERLKQNAGTLSGGEQQMLAIGRALMARPKLLLLDEPSLGISPTLIQQIFKVLVEINKAGTTILLVEQDAYLALKTASRAYVLETGQIKLSGFSRELLKNPEVQKAYLGG